MHVHVASSPAYKHMMKLPTTIFRTRQKEPGDEANTNIALLSAMKQQSLMLLVAYAMTDFALWQLVYSWRHEVTVYMTTYSKLVPLWISLTCCLQKWKQETQHMFTWSTWYMELVCINYTIPGPPHKHPLPISICSLKEKHASTHKHLNLYSIAMLISNTYTWHSPSVYGLSALTRAVLHSKPPNVHSCCLS